MNSSREPIKLDERVLAKVRADFSPSTPSGVSDPAFAEAALMAIAAHRQHTNSPDSRPPIVRIIDDSERGKAVVEIETGTSSKGKVYTYVVNTETGMATHLDTYEVR